MHINTKYEKKHRLQGCRREAFKRNYHFLIIYFWDLVTLIQVTPTALYCGYLLSTYFLICMLGLKSCAIMSLKNCYDCFCFNSVFVFHAWRSENTFLGVHSILHLVGTGLSILSSYCIVQITTCSRSPHSTVSLLSLSRSAGIRDVCHPKNFSPGFRNPILVKACTISAFTH